MFEVHAFDTGTLVANRTFLRGEGFGSLLRRVELMEFPAFAYVLEHPEGLIAVDTGLAAGATAPRRLRGFPPAPRPETIVPLAAQMRERGLDPREVRRVVLTHLDWDHTGGVGDFPDAEILVHRPEHDFARTRPGRMRYRTQLWPAGFAPRLYEAGEEGHPVTDAGDVRAVPLPGHSPGQVAVVAEAAGERIVFSADHALRADWFAEDLAAGRHIMLGAFGRRAARESTRRLAALADGALMLPAHDADVPARLRARALRPAGTGSAR